MALSLRAIVNAKLNLDTTELISDTSLNQQYLDAARYYVRFKLWPRSEYTFSITDGEYKIAFPIDQVIDVKDEEGNVVGFEYIDSTIKLFNAIGTYKVTVMLNIQSAYLNDLPWQLEQFFYFKVLKAIGEFLKFASYTEMPFAINAEGLYQEGTTGISDMKAEIQATRDEDPDNISDLKTGSYSGFYTFVSLITGNSIFH